MGDLKIKFTVIALLCHIIGVLAIPRGLTVGVPETDKKTSREPLPKRRIEDIDQLKSKADDQFINSKLKKPNGVTNEKTTNGNAELEANVKPGSVLNLKQVLDSIRVNSNRNGINHSSGWNAIHSIVRRETENSSDNIDDRKLNKENPTRLAIETEESSSKAEQVGSSDNKDEKELTSYLKTPLLSASNILLTARNAAQKFPELALNGLSKVASTVSENAVNILPPFKLGGLFPQVLDSTNGRDKF